MIKTLKLFLFFLFFSFSVFSQQSTRNPDGSITFNAKVSLYFSVNEEILTHDQFRDSIATQKYIFSLDIMEANNDTNKFRLVSKAPQNIVDIELPVVEWKIMDGGKIKYGDSGKITLLSFWSVICKPCIEEFNELNEWVAAYPDVRVIAVTSDSASVVSAFMEKNNLSWSNITIVPEYKGDFNDTFMVRIFPLNVVTDNRRVVKNVFIGKNKELMEYICSLL